MCAYMCACVSACMRARIYDTSVGHVTSAQASMATKSQVFFMYNVTPIMPKPPDAGRQFQSFIP